METSVLKPTRKSGPRHPEWARVRILNLQAEVRHINGRLEELDLIVQALLNRITLLRTPANAVSTIFLPEPKNS